MYMYNALNTQHIIKQICFQQKLQLIRQNLEWHIYTREHG